MAESVNEVKRLAKAISARGVCSRRQAEHLIISGRVKVNSTSVNEVVTFVTDRDVIEIDGQIIGLQDLIPRLWLYNKPRGLITTHYDPEGRATVFDNLPRDRLNNISSDHSAAVPHIISIGRLDIESEGLLLLTNSGALARHYELPENAFTRVYRVKAHGHFTNHDLNLLQQGVTIEGFRYRAAKIILLRQNKTNSWFEVTITEGKNREIRKLFSYIGLQVNRLIRIAYGPYELGNLKPGQVQECRSY